MEKQLSILVTNYNKEKYISYILTMLMEQITEEVVVHIYDDGSTDESVKIISQVLEEYEGDNIYAHFMPNNMGTGAIRETALQNVDTPYFIFVDADDLLSENYVQTILKYIKKEPQIDIHRFSVRVYPIGGTVCFGFSLWDKVLRTQFVRDNNLHFNTELRNMEDKDFMDRLYSYEPTESSHPKDILYVYNLSVPNSLTHIGDVWLNHYDNIKPECK